ncbi:MAG: SMP-30/gluconolactonase/LRE family protein [Pseudomonadota bacterium]
MTKRQLDLDAVTFVGSDLVRPECVITTPANELFVSDFRGGVTLVQPDGNQTLFAHKPGPGEFLLQTNGFALEPEGSFLIAHLEDFRGGVFRLKRDRTVEPFLTEFQDQPLPPTNFVLRDRQGRVWITVSTRVMPRTKTRTKDHADGFIILVDDKGPRIVAEGLGFTNECRLDADQRHLYVNETFGRRVTRFTVEDDGSLQDRRIVARFGPGTFPDGIEIDRNGTLWITSIMSNRVILVDPDGHQEIILEDADQDFLMAFEQAYQTGALRDAAAPRNVPSRLLRNISSLAFSTDGRSIYLGCLLGDRIAKYDVPWLDHG